jgi:PKD repeat protein
LTVTDDEDASDTNTTTATIADTEPTAEFSGTPTSGIAPLTVGFTDASTSYDGITAWDWDFDNDGTADSIVKDPSYIYTAAGTYTVSLTVHKGDGDSDSETKVDYIIVIAPAAPALTLEPLSDTNPVGTSHTLTATLVDADSIPMSGETITFTVAGVNPTSGTAVTDANGVAIWSYTGTNKGDDTIVATGAGVTSNEAHKTWNGGGGPISSMTEWGIIAMVVVLSGLGVLMLWRRQTYQGQQ